MGTHDYLSPWCIEPMHGVRQHKLFVGLATSMAADGWDGRPLLVIERADDYLAWTGSHRIHAAREAGLETIPCYIVDEATLKRHGVDAEHGHVLDYERLALIEQIGDEEALALMDLENRLF